MSPQHYVVNRCMTSVYLSMGVLELLKDDKELYSTLTEGQGQGQDGLVDNLCDLAIEIENWFDVDVRDPELLTSGVYQYEFVHAYLAGMVVSHAREHGCVPSLSDLLPRIKADCPRLTKGGTITIEISGGCLTDVSGLPEGWNYKLIDHDIEGS